MTLGWVLILIQLPTEPSRHCVPVWRELRRGGGMFAVIDAAPRDEAGAAMIRDAFAAARIDEWAEFVANCSKFDQEIVRESEKQKFNFGKPKEEEQRLDRLPHWFRDLKKRDVLLLPEAEAAEERLQICANTLHGYAEQFYQAARGHTTVNDTFSYAQQPPHDAS